MTTVGHLVTGRRWLRPAPIPPRPPTACACADRRGAGALDADAAPAAAAGGHADRHTEHDLTAARAIVERHGHDSISPFILRPDKSFQFADGAVLAYRVIGETAIVSGDPVGPDESVSLVLGNFLALARARRWRVVLVGDIRPPPGALPQPWTRHAVRRRGGRRRPGAVHAGGPPRAQAAPVGAPARAPRLGDHRPRRP